MIALRRIRFVSIWGWQGSGAARVIAAHVHDRAAASGISVDHHRELVLRLPIVRFQGTGREI